MPFQNDEQHQCEISRHISDAYERSADCNFEENAFVDLCDVWKPLGFRSGMHAYDNLVRFCKALLSSEKKMTHTNALSVPTSDDAWDKVWIEFRGLRQWMLSAVVIAGGVSDDMRSHVIYCVEHFTMKKHKDIRLGSEMRLKRFDHTSTRCNM